MKTNSAITQFRLKQLLDFDEKSGVFTWKNPNTNALHPGDSAGRTSNMGYVGIMLDGVRYQAHRLVWLWFTGSFPENELDHRNGIRDDNRFSNLREATKSENQQNQGTHANNTSGYPGVCWIPSTGRWVARIVAKGHKIHVGVFDDPTEAHAAYLAAKAKLHGFQPIPRYAAHG